MGKLGAIEYGRYHKSFDKLAQIIFIRHGEKVDDDHPDLSPQGYFRANNLYRVFGRGNTTEGAYNTPDVIYAMEQKTLDNSNRPFETVKPLAVELGMDPVMDERTVTNSGVFDNKFREKEHEELKQDLLNYAKNEYAGKTIMICWEHKNIPYIVAKFGLTTAELNWGLDPLSDEDADHNFTAIWVFTPNKGGKVNFQVFQQFDVLPEGLVSNDSEISLSIPNSGYATAVFSQDLEPNI